MLFSKVRRSLNGSKLVNGLLFHRDGNHSSSSSLNQKKLFATGVVGMLGCSTWSLMEDHSHPAECFGFGGKTLNSKGKLFTWGSNQFGQLGTGTDMMDDQSVPVCVDANLNNIKVEKISSFAQTAGFIDSEGKVFTFGRSIYGSLGQGDIVENCYTPTEVKLDAKAKSLSMGEFHMAIISESGDLFTAGRNWIGELGREGDTTIPGKVEIENTKFEMVSCGRTFTAAVDTEGKLYTWGNGKQGALCHGNLESYSKPTVVDAAKYFNGEKIKAVDCGQESMVILTYTGKVYTCGNNDYGKLGIQKELGGLRIYSTPQLVSDLKNETITQISCGDFHCGCVNSKGKLFTFGKGGEGQLGQDSTIDLGVPQVVSSLENVKSVSCGGAHTAVITNDGKLYTFGKGRDGELGLGEDLTSVAAYKTTPHHVHSFKSEKVKQVTCGGNHTMCLLE